MAAGTYEGREYGYDQVGTTDEYFDIDRTRYSVNPSEIKNINTPTNIHVSKLPFEQQIVNNKCQELILDLRDNKFELNKLKSELQALKEPAAKQESFLGGMDKDITVLFYALIFFAIVLVVFLQNIYQQNNDILRLMVLYLKDLKPS